ncbi:hypothetical protein V5O48_007616 [Marasmius crinis-equi]|uniref:Major facilitator superfamily (MFS) profile domain-containing protein n=1 Tax=Marasmius crinis-equi TaxID=585013 RepID=A0ABR3FGM1_9AGAR
MQPVEHELSVLPGNSETHSIRHIVHAKADSESAERASPQEPSPSKADSEAPFTQTKAQETTANIQLATLFWTLFLAGWNDGTTGPLLPRIQEVYHVSDTIVSLIFIFACVGFVSGACLNVPLSEKYGFGKALAFGSTLQTIAYALQSANLPFPVFVMAYTINGVGLSIQDAQANGFVASLKKYTEIKMGLLHAVYGVGAFAAPLVSTQFSQLERWSFHYLCSLGIALINTALIIAVFRFKTQDECLARIGQSAGERDQENAHGTFKQILTHRNVHLMAFFILVYVGVEVTIGGWIVTFVIRERHGGPSSGYVSSGFFGGLALGRVVLLWINALLGERNAMFLYAAIAISLELVVWLVPSLVGGAVAVSFVGFILGPMYPITMNHAGRTLPRWILTGSIGWIAGFGQAGSAVFPFATGALAGKYGIRSLQPLLVAMMAAMTVLWALVSFSGRRRKD